MDSERGRMSLASDNASSNLPVKFRVEFSVHLKYDKGETSFRREEHLPFVPFIGLDILDDALGEFEVKHVAWASHVGMLLCQSNVEKKHWTIRKACSSMKKAGWTEERECREPDS